MIAHGIRMSCKRKRDLHLLTKNKDDIKLKQYCILYFKISTSLIKEAKRCNYNEQSTNNVEYHKI
jgi:hypothetical protein